MNNVRTSIPFSKESEEMFREYLIKFENSRRDALRMVIKNKEERDKIMMAEKLDEAKISMANSLKRIPVADE